MDHKSTSVAGWASIALGVTYVLVGVGFLLQPEAQTSGNIDDLLTSYNEDSLGFTILQVATAIGGLFALAAVPAIAGMGSPAWSVWARNLGLTAFVVATVSSLRALEYIPIQASDFAHPWVNDPARLDIPLMVIRGDNIHMPLDPNGWITYGAAGLFVLFTAVAALRLRTMPKTLAILGIGAAIGYFLVVAGTYLGESTLISIAAAAGGVIVGPAFFIWCGLLLRRGTTEGV
jgi:hypothetical protein